MRIHAAITFELKLTADSRLKMWKYIEPLHVTCQQTVMRLTRLQNQGDRVPDRPSAKCVPANSATRISRRDPTIVYTPRSYKTI